MSRTIVVTGTDTDIGKTVFCAALATALGASYWKPIQAGLEDDGHGASDGARLMHGDSGIKIKRAVIRKRFIEDGLPLASDILW